MRGLEQARDVPSQQESEVCLNPIRNPKKEEDISNNLRAAMSFGRVATFSVNAREVIENELFKLAKKLDTSNGWRMIDIVSLEEAAEQLGFESTDRYYKMINSLILNLPDGAEKNPRDVVRNITNEFLYINKTGETRQASKRRRRLPQNPFAGISNDLQRTRGKNLSGTAFDRPLNLRKPGRQR